MGRIFEEKSLGKIVRETWSNTSCKIMAQIEIEKQSNSRLRDAIDILIPKESTEC